MGLLNEIGFTDNQHPRSFKAKFAPQLIDELCTELSTELGKKIKQTAELAQIAGIFQKGTNGHGFYLYGNIGTGKTIAGGYVLPGLMLRCWRQMFLRLSCSRLATYKEEEINAVFAHQNIFLDDIGAEAPLQFYGVQRDIVAEVISYAYDNPRVFLVCTGNLNGQAITERYGQRTYDRLRSICHCIYFSGSTLRTAAK